MKRWEKWMSHGSTIVVTASGLSYMWMKYGLVNPDPFSVVNHPWQPTMLSLHVLGAPLLVFMAGVTMRSHVLKKLTTGGRNNRRSGLASAITVPIMVLSGYGLQVLADPVQTRVLLFLHVGSSSVFVLTYLLHQVVSFRLGPQSDLKVSPGVPVRRPAVRRPAV